MPKRALHILVLALAAGACTTAPPSPQPSPTPGPSRTPQPTLGTSTPAPTSTSPPTAAAGFPTGSTLVRPADEMQMVYVPEGEFAMGADASRGLAVCRSIQPSCDPLWFSAEEPIHDVYLDAFWIDQTEVTISMYARCVEAGACELPEETSSRSRPNYYYSAELANFPVIRVTWFDAQAYCLWAGARLPTEAEWEKAARGTDGRYYPWGDDAPHCLLANISGCLGDTEAVGSHLEGASPYGALDMAGNVSEWVTDWFMSGYFSHSPASNPPGPIGGTSRVVRGGEYGGALYGLHASARGAYQPEATSSGIGFRCVMDVSR